MSLSEKKISPDWGRQHRTAVFIDVSLEGNNTKEYYERAIKMATSLNHEKTIKAHVFMVVGDMLVPYEDDWKNMPRSGGLPIPASELSAWAADKGFTQTVIVAPVGKRAA